jgi:16S rRNA pseudouridine516 synthase
MKIVKFLEQTTLLDSKSCEKLIKEKRIKVNDKIVTKHNLVVKEEKDIITLDDKQLIYEKFIYLMMNKRRGLVCATQDNFQKTIFEDIHEYKNRDLRIVGRLDKDTEGLLLITDDGNFIHHLTSPKHNINKTYYVEFTGEYKEEFGKRFVEGIILDDGYKTLPAEIRKLEGNSCLITIGEGKFHQVKRMIEAVGKSVTYLKRVSFGPLVLDNDLPLGKYRFLTEEEILKLTKKD